MADAKASLPDHPAAPTTAPETGNGLEPRKHFVLDTNVLLHNPGAMYIFAEHEVVIPLSVIEELDRFKKNTDETGRNARQTIRQIDRLRAKGHLFDGVPVNDRGGTLRVDRCDAEMPFTLDLGIVDNRILAVAAAMVKEGKQVVFISMDINARVKSDALGIPVENFESRQVDAEWLYSGRVAITVPDAVIDAMYNERQIPIDDLASYLRVMPEGAEESADATPEAVDLMANQFVVMTSEQDPSHSGLGRRLGETEHVIPVTKPRRPVYGVMARNVEQTMALDVLLDDDVKLVTLLGSAGTGKTLLALAAGMQKVFKEERYDRLLVARPIMPLGRDIGFLPGDKDTKLSMWMQPIFDNLTFLLSTRGSHFQDAESRTAEHHIDELMRTSKLVLEPLTYIRGRSIPNQFFVVDEVQNLTPHEVKTIVSRAGSGTKVIMTGDINQIDNPYLDASSNGLSYLVERMKDHALVAHVTLAKSERSTLASLAADVL